jgi:hypothetical protein
LLVERVVKLTFLTLSTTHNAFSVKLLGIGNL